MAYQLETGLEEYPELDAEAEELTVDSDDRPVSSQPFDWTISTKLFWNARRSCCMAKRARSEKFLRRFDGRMSCMP